MIVECTAKYCKYNKNGERCKKESIKLSYVGWSDSEGPECHSYFESEKKRCKDRGY